MEALVARLRENLDDQETWRVYGDWLLEQGDVRGELVQSELTEPSQRQAAAELRARHQDSWREGWPRIREIRYGWRHGFVCEAALKGPHMLGVLEQLLSHPEAHLLSSIELVDLSLEALEPMLSMLAGTAVRSLRLTCSHDVDDTFALGDEGAQIIARSPALSSLSRLYLGDHVLGEASALALAGAASLGSLTSLSLWNNRVGWAGVRALVESPALPRLASLNLFGNALGDEELRPFARTDGLRPLSNLAFGENRLGPRCLRALCASPAFGSLSSLDLSSNALGDAGVRALVSAPEPWRLVSLELRDNGLTDAGALALARAPTLRSLASLGLSANEIGDEGAMALAVLALHALRLDGNYIGRRGQRALKGRCGEQRRPPSFWRWLWP